MKLSITIYTFVTVLLFAGLVIAANDKVVEELTNKTNPVGPNVGVDIRNPDHFRGINAVDPGDIRYGATISGVSGSYKCGQSFVDNMKIECYAKCAQEFPQNTGVQSEACQIGCENAHTIIGKISN